MSYNRQSGFTMSEILIIISLVIILLLVSIAILNPSKQIERVWDIKRRQELAILTRVMDDFYNDHESYPISSDVCYDTPTFSPETNSCFCHICGIEGSNNPFKNYLQSLYCDPQHPTKAYLYQYDCRAGENPRWFRVCAQLSWPDVNLREGNFNYGIASSNISPNYCYSIPTVNPAAAPVEELPMITPTPSGTGTQNNSPTPSPTIIENGGPTTTPLPGTPTPTSGSPLCIADPAVKYCIKNGICNACGDQFNCHDSRSCDQPLIMYSDFQCRNVCI